MKNRVGLGLSVMVGLLMVSGTLFAHHSNSLYDMEQVTTVTGTVVEFLWNNPHVTILLDAKGASGKVEKWTVELSPPSRLHRTGWNSAAIKAGDQITVTGNPGKDGRPRISPRKMAVNGEVRNMGGQD